MITESPMYEGTTTPIMVGDRVKVFTGTGVVEDISNAPHGHIQVYMDDPEFMGHSRDGRCWNVGLDGIVKTDI